MKITITTVLSLLLVSALPALIGFASPAEAESLEEKQARSIEILRAGILSRPAVTPIPAPAAEYFAQYRAPKPEAQDTPQKLEVVVRIENAPRYGLDYDPYWDAGSRHTHRRERLQLPPVVAHVTKGSRISYAPEHSPHRDTSTAVFVRGPWKPR